MRAGVTALAAAAGVGLVVGAASFVGAPDAVVEEHPGAEEPVVRSALVCPYVGGEDDGDSHVGVLALPGVDAPAGEGEPAPATVRALAVPPEPDPDATAAPEPEPPADPEPVMTVEQRGTPVIDEVTTDTGTSFAVEGSGALAPGLAAEQSMLVRATDLWGLSSTPCASAGREHWFVGGSGEVGRRGRLVLSNPTDVPAVADVVLWDEAGPIDAPATQDIGVPARSQQILLLDALAPDSASVAVQVTTSQGRVSAALEVRESAEITPQGLTYIPPATPPAEELVVPGVPGHGQRTLRIVAPGEIDAIVSMQLYGPAGPYSPIDQDVLTVTGGAVLDVPLDDAAGDGPVSVALTSDEPITAAVRVVETPSEGGRLDVGYTAATSPLAGPATALLSRTTGGFASNLLLSAVDGTAARATVTTLAPDGTVVGEEPVDVPAGTTVVAPLAAPDGEAFASVVVTPDRPGSVVAVREMLAETDDGALFDLMPLTAPAITVTVPDVVGELPAVPDPDETAG
jgi:hypothetical protein